MKVWVNGTFDVLHIGHIKLLEFAKSYGEVRVGIDSDDRVKQKKGTLRPINNLDDRMEFLDSIKFVDSVVSFSTDEELISRIKEFGPDLMVIGSDYRGENIIGSEYIPQIVFFDRIPNKSTTNIIQYEEEKIF